MQGALVWSIFLLSLICVSVALIVVQTLPWFWEGEKLVHEHFWDMSEVVITGLFSAEYLVRLWCVAAPPSGRRDLM